MGNLIIQHFSTPAQAAGPGALLLISPLQWGWRGTGECRAISFSCPDSGRERPRPCLACLASVNWCSGGGSLHISLQWKCRVWRADFLLLQQAHADWEHTGAKRRERGPCTHGDLHSWHRSAPSSRCSCNSKTVWGYPSVCSLWLRGRGPTSLELFPSHLSI